MLHQSATLDNGPNERRLIFAANRASSDVGQTLLLQLEGVLFAAQAHQRILPSGERAGFFIGDGAGVGKGRQISGVILESACRGRPRHAWFSTSTDLVVDAERDLTALGCHLSVINGCQQLDRDT